jgi:RHS repeat-associated protein
MSEIHRMKRVCLGLLSCLLLCIAFLPTRAVAQDTYGMQPFGAYSFGITDRVDLQAMALSQQIHLGGFRGRSLPVEFSLVYSQANVWHPTAVGVGKWDPGAYSGSGGWSIASTAGSGLLTFEVDQMSCATSITDGWFTDYQFWNEYGGWVYIDPHGAIHTSDYSTSDPQPDCVDGGNDGVSESQYAPDREGDGWQFNLQTGTGTDVQAPDGTDYLPQYTPSESGGYPCGCEITDTNGNFLSGSLSGSTMTYSDTLGQTVGQVQGFDDGDNNAQLTSLSFPGPNGTTAQVTVSYVTQTVSTPPCTGYTPQQRQVSVPSAITLPDGSAYHLSYDGYGMLSSITMPNGGTVSYSTSFLSLPYTGAFNSGACAQASSITRYQGPNQTGPSWSYAVLSGTPPLVSSTQIVDPQGEKTVVNFSGPDYNDREYETSRYLYDANGTLLRSVVTCYDGTTGNCDGEVMGPHPTERDATTTVGSGAQALLSRDVAFYDSTYDATSSGAMTEHDEYGAAVGAPGLLMRKTLIHYATNIYQVLNRPSEVDVEDGSNALVAKTTYSYDESPVTSTSGVAAHGSPPWNTGRGNLTSMTRWTSASGGLTKHFTYFDTGQMRTATDVNGAQTSYVYGACGGSFVSQVNFANSTSRTTSWDCTGEVSTGGIDENGQSTTISYGGPVWQPTGITMPSGTVDIAYSSQAVSTTQSFNNGNSVDAEVTCFDGWGRAYIRQRQEGPGSSNYVSVETQFDSLGRVSGTTVPYQGGYCAAAPSTQPLATSTTYDALGRVASVSNAGGATTTETYTENDIVTSLGPAPSGESTKTRQFEYDGLGRLASVCEITGVSGNEPCSQANGGSGYLTQYAYNLLNEITNVKQGPAGSPVQQRAMSYDLAGRLTGETNPESGTFSYTYDGDSTCGNSPGDMVKKVDAMGNVTCNQYDTLHRLVAATFPSGPYASASDSLHFIYDGATVNGSAMQNAHGRLAEAYTVSSSGTRRTDDGFSYDAAGRLAQTWQFAPHLAWTTASASYYANGAVQSISGLGAMPGVSYGLDGMGRINSAVTSTNVSLVQTTTYNLFDEVTAVTLGSGDSEHFGYDGSTGRLMSLTLNINTGSLSSNFSWNANGSLSGVTTVDQLGVGGQNTSNCNFGYDDLGRLSSANCGPVWSQSFSFDPFGNLKKSGTVSSVPDYDTATNRIIDITGVAVSYDADGDIVSEPGHNYSWNTAGQPIAIDGTSVVYDALGRAVEKLDGHGAWHEVVYGPTGRLGIVNAQAALEQGSVALPGGGAAVYNSAGFSFFRHPDRLGSGRVGSTWDRQVAFDQAYGPYGEKWSGAYAANGFSDRVWAGLADETSPDLYDALFREYNAVAGRWSSPDPAGAGAATPTNPQSWNRYTYSLNRPLSGVDPSGLGCIGENNSELGDVNNSGNDNVDPGACMADGGTWSSLFLDPFDTSVEVSNGLPSTTTLDAYAALWQVSSGFGGTVGTLALLNFVPSISAGLNFSFSSLTGLDSRPPETAPVFPPATKNVRFTKLYLPANAQKCSAMLQFYAPPNFNLQAIVNAGRSNGLRGAGAAVGQYGTFDFQRARDSAGNTLFYSGYTPVANVAVGAYLQGAGVSRDAASLISNTYAFFNSSNGATAEQEEYRTLGWDLANAGWSPLCKSF